MDQSPGRGMRKAFPLVHMRMIKKNFFFLSLLFFKQLVKRDWLLLNWTNPSFCWLRKSSIYCLILLILISYIKSCIEILRRGFDRHPPSHLVSQCIFSFTFHSLKNVTVCWCVVAWNYDSVITWSVWFSSADILLQLTWNRWCKKG